jgi:hypothetical protein
MESKVSSLEMADFLYSCQAESQEKSRHLLTDFHTTPSSLNNQSMDGEFGIFFNPKIGWDMVFLYTRNRRDPS